MLVAGWLRAAPRARADADGPVLVGEARRGGLTIALPAAVADVRIRDARTPGRPIVLIDPGHGGRDPGATGVSGSVTEKQLTLAMASELADLLEKRGRVRVALAREGDVYLTLDQRAAIARRIGASLFVSLHMDSAPNPLARGATLYSLSDVASSEEAARFASAENRAGEALSSEADGSLRSILSDLALRGQMEQSAELARRTVRRAAGRVALRPRPHQFAAFQVLRRADTPALAGRGGLYQQRRGRGAARHAAKAARRSSSSWRRRSRPISRRVDCADKPPFRRAALVARTSPTCLRSLSPCPIWSPFNARVRDRFDPVFKRRWVRRAAWALVVGYVLFVALWLFFANGLPTLRETDVVRAAAADQRARL